MLLVAVAGVLALGIRCMEREARDDAFAPHDAGTLDPLVTTVLRIAPSGDAASPSHARAMFSSTRDLVVTAVTPDGRALCVTFGEPHEDIALLSTEGVTLRVWTDDAVSQRNASMSPRGDRVAFHSKLAGGWTTWLMRADGSERHALELPSGTNRITAPVWSPDGTQLAGHALQEGVALIVDVSDAGRVTRQRTLRTRTRGQTFVRPTDWSRDGERVVGFAELDDVTTGIAVLELDTDALYALPVNDAGAPLSAPRFLPDGRHVAYAKAAREVWVHDLDASLAAPAERLVHQSGPGDEVVMVVVGPDGALWVTQRETRAAR